MQESLSIENLIIWRMIKKNGETIYCKTFVKNQSLD
jgi:hypothetical protein